MTEEAYHRVVQVPHNECRRYDDGEEDESIEGDFEVVG